MAVIIQKLVWDRWNLTPLFQNHIRVRELDEACHNDPLFQEDKEKPGRAAMVGATDCGRILFAGGVRQGHEFYPIEVRMATELECGLYQRHHRRGGRRREPKEACTREQGDQPRAHGSRE